MCRSRMGAVPDMVRLRCAIRASGGCGVVQPVHRMDYGLEFRPAGALVGGHGQTPAVSIMAAVVHAGGEGDDRVGGSGMDSCLSCCFRQSRRGGLAEAGLPMAVLPWFGWAEIVFGIAVSGGAGSHFRSPP